MTIPSAPLGTTGMELTRVGFGAWAIGGGDWAFGWGPQDDADSIAAIRAALDVGINWIDTAAVYGLGHSEEVVAQALRGIPEADRPYVFTKCGLVWDEHDRSADPQRIGSPDSIRSEAEASLRRLGVDRIDLLQMHWPAEDGARLDDYWATLVSLRDEGKIRCAGLSNHRVAHLKVAQRLGHVDSLQPPFSAIHRATASALLPWCVDNQTGVIVYSPMQSGLLTGAFSAERVASLPESDFRSRSRDFTDHLERNLILAAAMSEIGARHETTAAAVAVAWTLAWPGVTGAIVGARRPGQIADWLPGASLRLSDEEMTALAEVMVAHEIGEGPTLPETPGT